MQDVQPAQASPPSPPQDVDELFPERADKQDVDSLFPASVEANRKATAAGISNSPIQDLIFGDKTVNPVARILDSFGQGFEQGWGADRVVLSDESKTALQQAGIKADDWLNKQNALVKAANVTLMRPYATQLYKNILLGGSVLDVANRSLSGAFRGAQAAVAQIGEEFGAPQLGHELAALPEAFPTGLHGPVSGMPIPGFGLSEAVRNSPGLIETARQLRVIGAGERGWAGTGPVEEAKPTTPVKVETSPQPVTGAPEQPSPMTAPPAVAPPIPQTVTPDIHAAARQAAPDVFARYDQLTEQQNSLRNWVDEQQKSGAEAPVAQARLDDVTKEIDTLAPQVAEAYRNAAASTNATTVPPAKFTSMAEMLASQGVPKGPEKYVLTDPLGAKTDGETMTVQVMRDKDGKVEALVTDHAVIKVAPAYRDMSAEGVIANELGDHPSGTQADLTKVQRAPEISSWGLFPPTAPAKIDATHTVLSGANSTADGTVVVDHNIPEFSPTLKDAQGNPANLHKYLAVHETVEADAMKRGMSYDEAHTKVATPAERAAVEADGVNWKAYTDEMDGYLDHIEHEPNTNPPPGQMHIDPAQAIGHHASENKVTPPPQAPIVQFRKDAAGIEQQLPPVEEGVTRLWRADRPGQTGTAFTNDLPGLALPFHAAYKGNLSYVDVPTADLANYENIAGTAHNAEFGLPPEIAATAKRVPRPIEAQRDFIVNDVKRQLIAAGRPEAEAQAAGQLVAARYEARATRLGGARGSAEELYKAEGAQIRGPGGAAAPEIAPTPAAEAIPESEITTTHVSPKAARGPRAVPQERWSLLQFIADRGGIKADDKNIGDVRTIFGKDQKWIPGFGPLIRKDGMALDQARKLAVEAGYLQDLGETGASAGEATSNLDTLLQAMDREERGTKVYRQGIEPAEAREREQDPAEREHYEAEQAAITKEINDYLKDTDQKASEIAPDIMARMREIVSRERIDPSVAHERAVMEVRNDAIEKGNSPDFLDEIPGWTVPDDARAASEGSRNAPQGEEASPGTRPRTDRDGDREAAWTEFYQRKRASDLIGEREAEGQQQIPGAERISDAERAQRAADQPLKPKAEQKPMDVGLFGDEKDQQELFQQMRGGIVLNPNAVPGHDYIGMENVRPLMRLTAEANASTFFHESGHQYLAELVRDAAHEAAPADLRADAQTVMDWLGLKGPQDLALGSDASRAAKIKATKAHEKFARGFEQYLREGIAPSPQLAGVFAKFKNWLMNIYQTIKGLGSPISDDIRGVFDRMLAEQPQRTVIAPEIAKRPDLQDIHESDAVLTEPHEAERAGDRVQAEDARARAELPKDIADEHRGSAEKIGTSPVEPIPLGEDRGRPDTIAPGGTGSAELGTEPQGGSHIVPQGAGLRTREGVAGTIEPLPIGPHVPLDALPAERMDKVGNIRLENLDSPAAVNDAIRTLYHENSAQLDAATRGVVSDQSIMDLADAMGVDPRIVANNMDRLRQMSVEDGVPLAARIWLMRDTFTKLAAEVSRTMQGTDEIAYAEARQRFLMAHETLSGITAEMGRGLRAFRTMKGATQSAEELAAVLKDATGKTLFQLQQEMTLGRASTTPAQVARGIQDAQKLVGEKVKAGVISYVINNLISGPITHLGYSIGNQVLQLWKAVPETAAAATIGAIQERLGMVKPGERVYFGEISARLYGMYYGAADGIIPAYNALKTGVSVMKGDPSGVDLFSSDVAYRPQQIPGKVGYVLETPSRSVAAIHTMHYGMNYEAEISAMAFRDSMKEGFDPGSAEFNQHMAEFRSNPPEDAMQIAHQKALDMVLMHRPLFDSRMYHLNKIINSFLPLKLMVPFMQVGVNMLDEGFIERTPLGVLSQDGRDNLLGRNGRVAQQTQYGQIAVGIGLASSVAGFTLQGIMTGGGPSDPKQREVLEMTGWKPYSIKIGGEYIPYRKYLSALGPLVAGVADMVEVGHTMNEEGLAKGASALLFGFSEVVADETWMRGLSSFVDAARHWDRDGVKYLRNMSMEFIPFSVGLRQIAAMTDPTWRSVRSEMDALRAHIPGMSQGLFPVRDLWGQPMRGGTMMSWSPAVNDPATIALQKAEYYPARPERKIRGVELTDQQYDDFTRIAGRDAKMRINAMISNPGFDLIPKQIRQEQLKNAMEGGRDMARTVILMQYPEIMKQALDAKHAILQNSVVH